MKFSEGPKVKRQRDEEMEEDEMPARRKPRKSVVESDEEMPQAPSLQPTQAVEEESWQEPPTQAGSSGLAKFNASTTYLLEDDRS